MPGSKPAGPGVAATELASHNRPQVREAIRGQFGQRMEATDIADAITYIMTRPRHVAVNEILIRPPSRSGKARSGTVRIARRRAPR